DRILNVGLNDVSVEGLARATGNEWFAHDCYRRLLEMYGETVDGVHYERLGADETPQHAIARLKRGYRESTGGDFPQDPREQLRRAIVAVFDSWQSPRAHAYRRLYEISHDLGAAVHLVQSVFGHRGGTSGTGRAVHPRPRTR